MRLISLTIGGLYKDLANQTFDIFQIRFEYAGTKCLCALE